MANVMRRLPCNILMYLSYLSYCNSYSRQAVLTVHVLCCRINLSIPFVGFEGAQCDLDIDECLSDPCHNAAMCEDLPAAAYRCHCLPGYTGVNCEVDVDECADNSCQNNATCIDLVNG